ncbi:hypothetical protein J2Z82_002356 [Virgibacillus litoralis]|uniref:Uncharacterized protein n=1 Tax=Virgibacillus litoralis TaxID=578221 RepID=A0ABS4HER6_9BACI|nr:hypothetical protein [Virgibacillus litoralis]
MVSRNMVLSFPFLVIKLRLIYDYLLSFTLRALITELVERHPLVEEYLIKMVGFQFLYVFYYLPMKVIK